MVEAALAALVPSPPAAGHLEHPVALGHGQCGSREPGAARAHEPAVDAAVERRRAARLESLRTRNRRGLHLRAEVARAGERAARAAVMRVRAVIIRGALSADNRPSVR